MSMRDYANKGWLQEQLDSMAFRKTEKDLTAVVDHAEAHRPEWVSDATIMRLRKSYNARLEVLARRG